jgi:hypothetical protein
VPYIGRNKYEISEACCTKGEIHIESFSLYRGKGDQKRTSADFRTLGIAHVSCVVTTTAPTREGGKEERGEGRGDDGDVWVLK